MKDSGIEWIGEIPDDWVCEKLKFHANIRNENIIDASDLDYIALENIESFSGKFIPSESQYDILQSKMAYAGDVLFGKLRPYLAKIYLLPKNAAVSAEFLVLSAVTVNKVYLKWYLLSSGFIDIVNASTYGTKMPRANADFIKNCVIPLPSSNKQQMIADFLDKKCAEIDCLIAHEEAMIDELKAYKQSVITEAVTKGLDRSVPMKDSDIEWIGEIPEEWEIVLLSSIFHQRKKQNSRLQETNLLSLSYGKIITKDIETREGLLPASFDTYNVIDNGDIVFRLTDLQNDQRSLRTGLCTQRGIITSAYITLRKNVDLESRYMHYLFHSYDICKVFYGMGDGVRQGMSFDDLKKLLVLFPAVPTQKEIADYLDKKCTEIDRLISLKQEKIDGLRDYKKSLIYEYVTGKKEVV